MKYSKTPVVIAFLCLLIALATIRATAERVLDFSISHPGKALSIQARPSPEADFRFFSNETEFLKAAKKVTVEGFEEFPQGTCVTGPAQGPGVEFPTANFLAVIQTYILYPGSTETVFLCAGDSSQTYAPWCPTNRRRQGVDRWLRDGLDVQPDYLSELTYVCGGLRLHRCRRANQ